MPLPGPKVSAILQTVTQTRAADMTITESTTDLVTMQVIFAPLSAREKFQLGKQTVTSIYRVMVAFEELAGLESNLIESNQIEINSVTYDITGVEDYDGGSVGRHFEVYLEEIE